MGKRPHVSDPRLAEMEQRFTEYTERMEGQAQRQTAIITRLTEQHLVLLSSLETIAAGRGESGPEAIAATALAEIGRINERFREAAATVEATQGSDEPQEQPMEG